MSFGSAMIDRVSSASSLRHSSQASSSVMAPALSAGELLCDVA